MATYPTLRQAEKILKAALPCDDCNCHHLSARLNVFRDGDTIRVSSFRLGCGKQGLIDLAIEKVEEEAEEVEDAADDGSE